MSEEVFLSYDVMRNGYKVYVRHFDGKQQVLSTKGGTEQQVYVEGSAKDDPIFAFIPAPVLKKLVDEANKEGVRPDKESVTEGKLIATQYHLEDMRKLAFRKKS